MQGNNDTLVQQLVWGTDPYIFYAQFESPDFIAEMSVLVSLRR